MFESCTTTPQAASPIEGTASYLTIAQVAQRLHSKICDVHSAVIRGELQAFQPGGKGRRILIRPTDLERYVAASLIVAQS